MQRKMIYARDWEDAPEEVWLTFSAMYGDAPPHDFVLEDDDVDKPDLEHMPVRYVRADIQS